MRVASMTSRADTWFDRMNRTPSRFRTDKARTYCIAEGVLLDVRTGVIPFSAVATREVRVEETTGGDVNFYETMQKAEAQATAEALTELAQQLSADARSPRHALRTGRIR